MGSPLRPVKATSDVLSPLSPTRQRSLTSAAISRARLRPCGSRQRLQCQPNNQLVVSFEQAHATALKALETLPASIDQSYTEIRTAMSRVADVTANARSTASGVKDLADSVAVEAEGLGAQVCQFLSSVQAA